MEPYSTKSPEIRKKRKRQNEPKEFSHCRIRKVQKIVFRRLLHNIMFMCLILMNARDCAKSKNEAEKKYTQLNEVYLKLNLSCEFMRTNQHICASTTFPSHHVCLTFVPSAMFLLLCSIGEEYTDERRD